MNPIVKKFGPFRLSGGQHVEDEPIGVVGKVKNQGIDERQPQSFKNGKIRLEVGGKDHDVPVDSNGAMLDWQGKPVSAYKERPGGGWQRAAASGLYVGDEVELCREVTYGPPDAEDSHKARFPHVVYAPFMSKDDLSLHNKPAVGLKFITDKSSQDANEMQGLRDQVEALRRRNAELEAEKGREQPQGQQDPPKHGQQQDQKQGQRKAG